ncbi:hypothetical protein HK097_006571 [Rhizophlyctis rosea]|uniref:Sorting nexin protein WASP-binding domain-containing protein n=1 Tax=Rhizophlyctis rosea TaxID=64517 RepID=A0AAD5SE13_9FUNG|nr:hypothetical protein HK097_006571 [Rhizophlyctis rosea]
MQKWINSMSQYEAQHATDRQRPGPARFFARVQRGDVTGFDFSNVELMDRFSDHIDMMETRLEQLLDASSKHQTLTSELSEQYEAMAQSLEALARGKQEDNRVEREICWCWRKGCGECHEFSSSMLGISKQMHGIAETFEGHSAKDLSVFNESAREYHALLAGYQSLVQLYDMANVKYEQILDKEEDLPPTSASSDTLPNAAMKTRLETVMDATSAEVARLHDEKVVGWKGWMVEWLDGMIGAQEKVLKHLRAAREALVEGS